MELDESQNVRALLARCAHRIPRLATIATGVIGSKSESEDIVQQAVEIAIRKDQTFETENQFVGWLAGIVRNCALNHRRKLQRRKTFATDPSTMAVAEPNRTLESPVDAKAGALKPLQQNFDDTLASALMNLENKMRVCVLLRIVEGLSYKEISETMEIPEQTAMNLVHRGKKKLRASIGDRESGALS